MNDLTVAIVAKECVPGRVKTRLTPPLLPEEAARLARASLDDTIDLVRSLPVARRILFFAGRVAHEHRDLEVMPQPEGDLDARLGHLFDAVDGPLLLIGMDPPQLTRAHIAEPVRSWPDDVDGYFGPAEDGGFWALAMREPDGSLIRGVSMSTSSTGREQRRRLVQAGLRVRDLAVVRDVDRADDARRVAEDAPGGRFAAVWQGIQAGAARVG